MIKPLLATSALTLLLAAPAAAEPVDITRQAKAARAEFLLTTPPPGPPATICIVDTGVDATPDTSAVIARISLDDALVFDRSPSKHGTMMASYIAAPANGYGMIGLWPAARIVSVRSNVTDQDAFTAPGYVFGMERCDTDSTRYGTKVMLLALATEIQPTPQVSARLASEVAAARRDGINVVVAAGNLGGRPLGSPANAPGVLSVGASDTASGALCGVSAQGAALLAPGCGLDGADPVSGQPSTAQGGTSHAAAIAAAALAALRTWRPDLGPDAAQQLLVDSAAKTPTGLQLDVTAAFNAAGLQAVTKTASPPVDPSPVPTPAPPAAKPRLATPKLAVSSKRSGRDRILTVRIANRPRGAKVTIRVYSRSGNGKSRQVAKRVRTSSSVRIRVRSWRRVTAVFSDPSGQRLTSRTASAVARR